MNHCQANNGKIDFDKFTYSTNVLNLDDINQQINNFLHLISKLLNHDLTLLVYSYDLKTEHKLNCFELSFDNYKYFSRSHSVLLNEEFLEIAKFLISETRKKQLTNHLNSFLNINETVEHTNQKTILIAQYLKSLHYYCKQLHSIEHLSIHNYIQYNQNYLTIFTSSDEA